MTASFFSVELSEVLSMYHYLAAVIFVLLSFSPLLAEDCTVNSYRALVVEAKSADVNRNWNKSAELYNRLLSECMPLINAADLVKAYDALSVALMMSENYSAAIDGAKKCIELDKNNNSCMMTACLAYEKLGDFELAISFANSAIEVGGYDEYSSAVVLLAKDFLKRHDKASR